MTVAAAPIRSGPFVGNGSQVIFTLTFTYTDATHIRVLQKSTAGVVTTLTEGVDYTANPALVPAQIQMTVAPAAGVEIVILGNVAFDQDADLDVSDSTTPTAVENALDDLSRQIKQLEERLDRSLTFNEFSTFSEIHVTPPESTDDGKALTWDNTNQQYNHVTVTSTGTAVISTFGASLIDDADASAARTTLGVVPGVDVVEQSVYDAHIADPDAHQTMRFNEPVINIVDLVTSADTSFTSETAVTVGGDVARFVYLRVRLLVFHAVGAKRELFVRLRRTGNLNTGSSLQVVECRIPAAQAANNQIVNVDSYVWVPLSTNQQYQYEIRQTNPVGTNQIEITQVGYMT